MTTNRTTTLLPAVVEVLVWSHGDVDVLHVCVGCPSRIEVVQAGEVLHSIPTTRQWMKERMRARRWAEAHLGLRGYDSLEGLSDREAKRRLVILLTNGLDYLTNLPTEELRTRYGRGAASQGRSALVRAITAREERRYSRLPLTELRALWA